jgi:hypothetical protein
MMWTYSLSKYQIRCACMWQYIPMIYIAFDLQLMTVDYKNPKVVQLDPVPSKGGYSFETQFLAGH